MKRPIIKYCGNKSHEDVLVVSKSNADYIGFIFADSKRKVEPTEVKNWLQEVDIQNKKVVGVFVNAELDDIMTVLDQVPLSIIQCHGTESVEFVEQIKEVTTQNVWKVIHHNNISLQEMKQFKGVADGYVIDTKVANMWGGSGVSFDWKSVPKYQREAHNQGVPCFIAGGIHSRNISELLQYEIDGFDISSGIELEGKKDYSVIQTIEKQVDKYEQRT
ncbi:phosphoribosylanthranilate isomerase [Ferdinandcohnia sp. Marseille-Q9671]